MIDSTIIIIAIALAVVNMCAIAITYVYFYGNLCGFRSRTSSAAAAAATEAAAGGNDPQKGGLDRLSPEDRMEFVTNALRTEVSRSQSVPFFLLCVSFGVYTHGNHALYFCRSSFQMTTSLRATTRQIHLLLRSIRLPARTWRRKHTKVITLKTQTTATTAEIVMLTMMMILMHRSSVRSASKNSSPGKKCAAHKMRTARTSFIGTVSPFGCRSRKTARAAGASSSI